MADWIGRQEVRRDRLDDALAIRWLATFDRAGNRDTLPQGIHFCLCTPDAPTALLGEDGHPARGEEADTFLPPLPLPRRMWAGSRIEFLRPLAIGQAIERTSRIADVGEKEGSRGKLGFVTVAHEMLADGEVALREEQTLVYLPPLDPEAPLSPPPPGDGRFDASGWDASESLVPDERLLFRYSALTFNTHRIHYDAPYARKVERYRGLVVHGPLMASLLLRLAARTVGENALRTFAFRAISPAVAGERLHLALRQERGALELGTFAGDGRQVVRAEATLA